MKYTIHRIIRTKVLNEKYYEVLYQRDKLITPPGSQIELLDGSRFLVASGLSEPWSRLIVSQDRVDRLTWGKNIKILCSNDLYCTENLQNPGQTSLLDENKPGFIVGGESIAVALSYMSTYPDRKVEVVYLDEHPIHLDWLKVRAKLKREKIDLDTKKKYYTVENNKGVILHG